MAFPFKIPKKQQPTGSGSPLSPLQGTTTRFKSSGYQSSTGGADRVHAGNSLGSTTDRQRMSRHPPFREVVKVLLGLNNLNTGGASQPRQKTESSSLSNGWRPKRASDRLLKPEVDSKSASPPQKKKNELNGSSSLTQSISVESVDTLAKVRAEEHAGSLSLSPLAGRPWRRVSPEEKSHRGNALYSPQKQQQKKNSSHPGADPTSEDKFLPPSRAGNRPPSSSVKAVSSSRTMADCRWNLDRAARLAASNDVREEERQRWMEFRDRKTPKKSPVLRLRLKKRKQTPAEPIVLSSEEEEEREEEEDDGAKTKPQSSSSWLDDSHLGNSETTQTEEGEGAVNKPSPPPSLSFLQLEFTSLHAGLTRADANGKMMITEVSIRIPLKGAEEGEVSVVASQVRGYGIWDGGVAQDGTLLAGWEGPAPSLLFLWVTDAQTSLLQRELSNLQASSAASGPPCSFILLVLKEQLQELQAGLLASIMDMEYYKKGRTSSTGGPTSPLEWTDGLVLFHSCPPPLDQHLLGLLGHSSDTSSQVRRSQKNKSSLNSSGLNSSGLQQLPTRLIQYPAPPCKGRITVTKEDLACLDSGQFLNDVIIDFYLKYLLLEGVVGSVAERSHVFSSFFYKQLSRRRAAGEDDAPCIPDRRMRHQRVKTWTRHVDIFTKDFLFVPVNQEAHWYLVVVCFPGVEQARYEEFQSRTGGSERAAGKPAVSLRALQAPGCTEQGCDRDSVMKRPCILVMDSLKLSYHENVCRLLRDYLQVEWQVRRGTSRLFTSDTMRSSSCRVPQQDNSSDCGLYLLQYVESFLQNPVVHFDLPLNLDSWFLRQHVRQKREEIRHLIMRLHQSQTHDGET